MRALYLLRHSLTEANERRLYCGWTDLPLSPAGQALAEQTRLSAPLPEVSLYVTSGLRRADETLALLTGRTPDLTLPNLREMHFGRFELHSYEELKGDGDYQRWIDDCMGPGIVPCPGGESQRAFRERVLRGGEALLGASWESALAVVHGGVIANLMSRWFLDESRNFYEWQPGPCAGYRIGIDGKTPVCFETV